MRTGRSGMNRKAFSLVECLITMVLLLITIGCVISLRYFTTAAAERAENQLMAAHTAQLLSEAWKTRKADPAFSPVSCSYAFGFLVEALPTVQQSGAGAVPAVSGTHTGSWRITIGEKEFTAHLFYRPYAAVGNMRQIDVIVTWRDSGPGVRQFYLPSLASTI